MAVTVLDCTLRDGGYINNWAFGKRTAQKVIERLSKAHIDYVEIGFLRNNKTRTETTVFTSLAEADSLLSTIQYRSKIFAMILDRKFDLDRMPLKSETRIDGIRVVFKKNEIDETLQYMKKIQEKGYMVSANPSVINSYTDQEFLELIEKVNYYKPNIFAVVDTFGVLKPDDMRRLLRLISHNLDQSITLDFHSHNNLQLSFANVLTLLETKTKREIIVDSSICGMGRGAGNLCTELIIQHLNDNFGSKYDLAPILECMDEQIRKIYIKTPWGYNAPYFLTSTLQCHPNYASFLMNKANISTDGIFEILKIIPKEKYSRYDEALIQELYLRYPLHKTETSRKSKK